MKLRIVPSWATNWAAIRSQMPLQIAVILMAFVSIFISTRNPLYAIALVILSFGLGALGTWMYFRNTSVEVFDNGQVIKRSWLGTSRTFSFSEIATSLYALQVGVSWAPAAPTLILMRADGTAVLRLRGQLWERSAIEALIPALGITPIVVPQRVTPKDLKVVHPRAISWYEANPVAFAAILGGSIFALAILTVVIIFAVLFAQYR